MYTKKILAALLATSALAAPAFAADLAPVLKAPPVPAIPPVSGYLEMEGGGAWLTNRANDDIFNYRGSDDKWLMNGAGRVNVWWNRNVSTQFDVWGGFDSFSRKFDDGYNRVVNKGISTSFNAGGHLSYRVPEQYLFGIFGALGGLGSNGNCCFGNPGFIHGTIGLEAQYYLANLTLYGQGGVQGVLSSVENNSGTNGDAHFNAWFLRGVARYFVNDNLKLEGQAFWAQGKANSEDFIPFIVPTASFTNGLKMQHFVWGVGIEKRFDASPFSVFARYEGSWTKYTPTGPFDAGYSAKTTENMVKVGFRVYLNENTLKFNDRMGTTLDIRDPLTSAYRATGRTANCVGNCAF